MGGSDDDGDEDATCSPNPRKRPANSEDEGTAAAILDPVEAESQLGPIDAGELAAVVAAASGNAGLAPWHSGPATNPRSDRQWKNPKTRKGAAVGDAPKKLAPKISPARAQDSALLREASSLAGEWQNLLFGQTPDATMMMMTPPTALVARPVIPDSTQAVPASAAIARAAAAANARTTGAADMVPCDGIARGNFGSVLSYVAVSMRASALELEKIAHTPGREMLTAFSRSKFSQNPDFVIPYRGLIARKLGGDEGYGVFSADCSAVAPIPTRKGKIPRCRGCSERRRNGDKYIQLSHQPTIDMPGASRAPIKSIINDPRRAEQEIRRLRTELKEEKKKNANAEAAEKRAEAAKAKEERRRSAAAERIAAERTAEEERGAAEQSDANDAVPSFADQTFYM